MDLKNLEAYLFGVDGAMLQVAQLEEGGPLCGRVLFIDDEVAEGCAATMEALLVSLDGQLAGKEVDGGISLS